MLGYTNTTTRARLKIGPRDNSEDLPELMIVLTARGIVEDLPFHPVVSRLIGWMLDIFNDAEEESIAQDLMLEDIASHIGTTREMAYRHAYRFAEEEAIEINRTEPRTTNQDFYRNAAWKVIAFLDPVLRFILIGSNLSKLSYYEILRYV
jgi:hypothetical protein